MRGGKADGFGLVDVGGLSGGEPGVELGEGVGGELGALEGTFGILVCLLGGFVASRSNYKRVSRWRGFDLWIIYRLILTTDSLPCE